MPFIQFDNMEIEILEDGTIKVLTDEISAPNHILAENFLKFIATNAGGETTRERRIDKKTHSHSHSHAEREKQ